MTAHEWKLGDLAVITEYGTEIPAVMVDGACRVGGHVRSGHWHYFAAAPNGATWTSKEQPAARPLVVIDPEDREQTDRLANLVAAQALGPVPTNLDLQAALREFANPKPDEPQQIGAVVEDDRGRKYVRVAVACDGWMAGKEWQQVGGDINAVRNFGWSDLAITQVVHEGMPS